MPRSRLSPEVLLDAACLPALTRVMGRVLALHDRVLAGDLSARAEVEALDALLEQRQREMTPG